MNSKPKTLLIGHINARSLLHKFIQIKNYLENNNIDIMAITETWLTDLIINERLSINGYKLLRFDRRQGRGGGIVIYVRTTLHCQLINIHVTKHFEQLWIEFKTQNIKTLLGAIYRPPGYVNFNEFLEEFELNISQNLLGSDNLICIGDFNINGLDLDSLYTQKFFSLLQSYGLKQIINEPTRYGQTNASLIDFILCSNSEFLISSEVDPTLNISDHLLIKCKLKLQVFKREPFSLSYRNFRNFNKARFYNDLLSVPFYNIFYTLDINKKLKLFNTYLIELFNIHAPIQTARISKRKAPWLTQEIKNAMWLRNKALHKYKKNKTPENWHTYKSVRNQVTIAVEKAKRQYLSNNITPKNSKNNWKILRDLNIYSKPKNILPPNLDDVEEINRFFIQAASSKNPDPHTLNFYLQNHKNGVGEFNFHLASMNDIETALISIKSEAIGSDGIGIKMLCNCYPLIVPIILHLVNTCIETNSFPEMWKSSFLLPIPKISNPSELKDLRPISILPTMSKILEKVLDTQIRKYIETYNLLPTTQSGFRKNHNCSTALLKVTDDILEAADRNELTALVLLDYSKAFDKLNHHLLIAILKYLGFQSDACNMIKSYLAGRLQSVKSNGQVSKPISSCNGIPQGSILGPLFFILYSSQLCTYLKYSQVHLYADDSQIYLSFKPEQVLEGIKKLNEDLEHLVSASEKHCLELNPKKCQLLIFGQTSWRNIQHSNHLNIFVGTEKLENSSSARNLGLVMDVNLRFTAHINNCIKKAFTNLKLIYNQRHLLNINLKKLLCESLVLTHFTYCDVVYGPCLLEYDVKRIQRIQNHCVRLIGSIRKYDRGVTAKMKEIGWLTMKERRTLHSLTLYNKIIFSKLPNYLYQKIKFRYDTHNLDLRYKQQISPPLHRTALYERSFSYQVYSCYNKVPDNLKRLNSFKFKNEICKIISIF